MRLIEPVLDRAKGVDVLTRIIIVLFCLVCIPSLAYSTAEQVYDAPGGSVVGGVRDSDSVQIKQLETVYRNGHDERWAYITYGDRYTRATGWVNLDNFRKQPPKAPTSPNSAYSSAPGSDATPAAIWDINMNCTKNQRRVIQSCELQMVVDIPQTYDSYDPILACSAELFWTDSGGAQRVSRQQASQPVGADGNRRRQRLELYFNFGQSGARNATVENQKCQTTFQSQSGYAPY